MIHYRRRSWADFRWETETRDRWKRQWATGIQRRWHWAVRKQQSGWRRVYSCPLHKQATSTSPCDCWVLNCQWGSQERGEKAAKEGTKDPQVDPKCPQVWKEENRRWFKQHKKVKQKWFQWAGKHGIQVEVSSEPPAECSYSPHTPTNSCYRGQHCTKRWRYIHSVTL